MKSWDVNAPYLYRLCVVLLDGEGRTVEAVPYRVGFRRFEIKNRIMHLNGRRLIINGVNRHEWNPRRGRSVTEEDMRKTLKFSDGITSTRCAPAIIRTRAAGTSSATRPGSA